MRRAHYTYHNAQAIDITDDLRPTAWEASPFDMPFRPVKDHRSELLIYVYNVLMASHLSASWTNPHVSFALFLLRLLDIHFKLHGISSHLPAKNKDIEA